MDVILNIYSISTAYFTNTVFLYISVILLHNIVLLNKGTTRLVVFVFDNMIVLFYNNTMLCNIKK